MADKMSLMIDAQFRALEFFIDKVAENIIEYADNNDLNNHHVKAARLSEEMRDKVTQVMGF